MNKIIGIIIFLLGIGCYYAQNQADVNLVKYEELEKKIQSEGDKLLVVNFWSTTCAPCVKELPYFMEVNNKHKNNPKFKMILVSLDRGVDKGRVLKFIKNKNLTAEVILLDDIKRMNTWIPRFEKDWDGNIPVTIFYKNGEKVDFNDGEMSKEELENTITKYLN
ncbi:TlpA family protein disulfide reductase [Chryseobacterium gwangjuense]|uniref:TlpA family protein disulfide reductase n=1 Tax=Chryseobacterium gwangjuense TaxID=1069980 RepID=UPI001E4BBF7C|nr:TlpA disulfide reductase family protein [Chryseobacterium gwangjuense]MCE3075226.1 TlpA family protein disulfide reductase [Chryseobacterium gwangjuense]